MSYLPGEVKAPARLRSLTDPQPARPDAKSAITAALRKQRAPVVPFGDALRRVRSPQSGATSPPQYRTKVKNPGRSKGRNQARPNAGIWRLILRISAQDGSISQPPDPPGPSNQAPETSHDRDARCPALPHRSLRLRPGADGRVLLTDVRPGGHRPRPFRPRLRHRVFEQRPDRASPDRHRVGPAQGCGPYHHQSDLVPRAGPGGFATILPMAGEGARPKTRSAQP